MTDCWSPRVVGFKVNFWTFENVTNSEFDIAAEFQSWEKTRWLHHFLIRFSGPETLTCTYQPQYDFSLTFPLPLSVCLSVLLLCLLKLLPLSYHLIAPLLLCFLPVSFIITLLWKCSLRHLNVTQYPLKLYYEFLLLYSLIPSSNTHFCIFVTLCTIPCQLTNLIFFLNSHILLISNNSLSIYFR